MRAACPLKSAYLTRTDGTLKSEDVEVTDGNIYAAEARDTAGSLTVTAREVVTCANLALECRVTYEQTPASACPLKAAEHAIPQETYFSTLVPLLH
jgi:hypothetical protein